MVSQTANRTYKVAIYTRLSVEDIRKKVSDSIGNQKSMLMEYLQYQSDMQLFGVYEDVNYTGTNFKRPGFARMIGDIRDGLVDCVMVKDLSRFGRNFEEMGHYLERVFPSLQVRFVSVGDKFDSKTATIDEFFLMTPLKNLMNEVFARDISKKTQSGFKAKQQRGEFCGSFAPYGYVKEGRYLAVDEEAAAVVRWIYEWRMEGMGIAAIVRKLNSLQVPPPGRYHFEKGITKAKKYKESAFWYTSAVNRILSHSVYIGNLVLGRYKSNFLKGGGAMETDESDWLIFEGSHPAIITDEVFEAVRNIRESRKKDFVVNSNNLSRNIFKGLIICGDCGGYAARERRREKFVYECYVHKTINPEACTKKAIKEADLQDALHAYIKCNIDLAVDMGRIISNLQKQRPSVYYQNSLDKQIAALNKKLEENRRFRGSLREDFKDGILTQQDYAAMKADYDTEKDKLQQNLDELIAAKTKQNEIVSPDNGWMTEFRCFETEQQLSASMASAFIKRIKVYEGGRIEVLLRYRDELDGLQRYMSTFNRK